jgi:hypothetical protein
LFMEANQGHLSSSVSGFPDCIFALFSAEWKSSSK